MGVCGSGGVSHVLDRHPKAQGASSYRYEGAMRVIIVWRENVLQTDNIKGEFNQRTNLSCHSRLYIYTQADRQPYCTSRHLTAIQCIAHLLRESKSLCVSFHCKRASWIELDPLLIQGLLILLLIPLYGFSRAHGLTM